MRLDPPKSSTMPLLVALVAGASLACAGLVPAPGGGGDAAPARGLDVGDPGVDAAIDAAVREQAARDEWVESVKEGASPSRADEVDDAWRAVFGEAAPARRRPR